MKDEKKLQIARVYKSGSFRGLGLLYNGELLPCQTGVIDIKASCNSYADITARFSISSSEIGVITYEITEKEGGRVKSS